MVVGSRAADAGGPLGLSRLRALTSQSLTILAKAFFPRLLGNVSDPLTGLFLLRRAAVEPAALQPEGFKILLEILVRYPDLRVSEIHFEFGPRHAGQSKADFHEGIRFFRHLLRLRFTANQHLPRFLVVGVSGLVVNGLLLTGLVEGLGLHYLLAAVAATQGSALWNFFLTEGWVFSDRVGDGPLGQRLVRFLLMNEGLLLIHLPLMALLVEWLGLHYLPANLLSIFVTTLVRYILSDQWIWTSGFIPARPQPVAYDLHGLLFIESAVPMAALAPFLVEGPLPRVDLRLLVDRRGTPRCLPGALCYAEGPGRFGFGVTVMPGAYTEVVVSPLLRGAPETLFRQVVEPLLRWLILRQGAALLPAVAMMDQGRLRLASLPAEVKPSLSTGWRQAEAAGLAHPAPVLVDGSGQAYSLAAPVQAGALTGWRGTWARALGRWLVPMGEQPPGALQAWRAALIERGAVGAESVEPARARRGPVGTAVVVESGTAPAQRLTVEEAAALLVARLETWYDSPVARRLAEPLAAWGGQNWRAVERQIIAGGLENAIISRQRGKEADWWRAVMPEATETASSNTALVAEG
jgi:putative flippase GtrA